MNFEKNLFSENHQWNLCNIILLLYLKCLIREENSAQLELMFCLIESGFICGGGGGGGGSYIFSSYLI